MIHSDAKQGLDVSSRSGHLPEVQEVFILSLRKDHLFLVPPDDRTRSGPTVVYSRYSLPVGGYTQDSSIYYGLMMCLSESYCSYLPV